MFSSMPDAARIFALLAPFLGKHPPPPQLIPQLQTYLELLLRWNAHINLTAIRDPEQIVTRHFGESLFAGQVLLASGVLAAAGAAPTLADLGSGAGFPGIPIKLLAPQIYVTLIESNHKKAAFLREAIRNLNLEKIEVFWGRAESLATSCHVVTLRAVEKFESVLQTAADLVLPGGRLCLLVGEGQHPESYLPPDLWRHLALKPVPFSGKRVVFIAEKLTRFNQ